MGHTRFAVLLVALVAVGVPAGVAAASGGGGAAGDADVTLTVTVVDGNGTPVEDVEVVAEYDGGSTTEETASNGKAFVDVPEGARVQLRVDHPDYVRNNPVVVESASEQSVTVQVSEKASTTVTVRDASGDPVEGARVELHRRGRLAASGRTDGDGTFESGTVERGAYRVVAVKSGYLENQTGVTVSGSTPVSVTLQRGTVTLTFEVSDDHFSPPRPIADAEVRIGDVGTLKTTSDGIQTAAVPANTDIEMSVTKEGYEETTRTVTVGEESRTVSFTVSRADALTLTADNEQVVAGTTVRVTVTDEYDQPVGGAAVSLDGEQVGTTDADGTVTVSVDDAGEHELVASNGSVSSDPVAVEAVVPAGEQTDTPTGADDEEPTDTGTEQAPGFGAVAALVALVVAVAVVRRA